MSAAPTLPPDTQENATTAKAKPQKDDAGPDAAAQPENAPHLKPRRTVGNRIYDWGIYTTFAWAGVAAVSLLSAHEAMHGRNPHFNWLRSLNNNVSGGLKKILSNSVLKDASKETIDGWANGTTMFVTLGLGGTTMMLPIKWLEDNRQKNACRIDNMLGTTPPHPELVEREVPQTWKSVLTGRMFAWGMSYGAFLLMGPKLTGKISKGFGKGFTETWMHFSPKSNAETVRKWADIGAFDATFTAITATLTYITSRFVAKRSDHSMDAESTLMSIDPSTPAPLEPLYNDTPSVPEGKAARFSAQHKPAVCAPRKRSESFSENLHAEPTGPASPSLG